ncbi:MAG: acetyl-CoA hydrolase/transferase C-terminal domain-containing protein [Candidatus Izemoplasmatales bacterium]|nr:acetyl-CoA hydrolase/transferase C-terminal domain-containing protein [bacterium]MDZ4197153.1 acetyl-CoA hydrolase/transferase C-terminal domain-containing protein [Candidatus Izemoplasmatales bacterium]
MKTQKWITPEEAVRLVQTNDDIVVASAANEPQLFMNHLHLVADLVKNVTVTNCLPVTNAPFFVDGAYTSSFQLDGWFYTNVLRKAHEHGNISFIPNHLHLAGKKRLYHKPPRIFVTVATPPDKHGYLSLSLSNIYEKEMLEKADIVIVEVNPNFPRTFGEMEFHISTVDYLIKADYLAPIIPIAEPNEKDTIIGNFIASKINDGDTIQLGIGGIPNAVARALVHKKDLGIHTEMFTTGMMELIKAGAITGNQKTLHRKKHVCCFAYGTQELYDFIDDNPSVMILNGSYVNDPAIMGLNDNQVSINSTIEVDLTGQCASESIGPVQFSGTGGQSDTAVGAQNAKNGRSFISLYSTALVKDPETGQRVETSKIVATLKLGAAVSLSRNDVDHVVTEYGIVSLRGTNIMERVQRLISIAHPKFRDQLRKDAIQLGYLHE